MVSSTLLTAFCYSSYQINISIEVRAVSCGVHSLVVRLWESQFPTEDHAGRRIHMAVIPHYRSCPTSSWSSALGVHRCATRETVILSTTDRHAWSENGL